MLDFTAMAKQDAFGSCFPDFVFDLFGGLVSCSLMLGDTGWWWPIAASGQLCDHRSREQVIFWGGLYYKTRVGSGLEAPHAFSSYMEVSEHCHR